MNAGLRSAVVHDVRLNILGCLDERGPMTDARLGQELGIGTSATAHHLRILDAFELVGRTGEVEDGRQVYAAHLDEHPAWVLEAVENREQE